MEQGGEAAGNRTSREELVSSVGVVVPAAGAGQRMGDRRKAFLSLAGEPLLLHTLRPFLQHPGVKALAVALAAEDLAEPPDWLAGLDERVRLVEGGATRLHSVGAALDALPEGLEVVLIHDAARPLVTREIVDRCLEAVASGLGAVAGWPAVDTLKEVDEAGEVRATPDRTRLWQAQTPQAFPRASLVEAYRRAEADGIRATDDEAVYALNGGRTRMVEGHPWNLKVTHPEDLAVAERLLELRSRRP